MKICETNGFKICVNETDGDMAHFFINGHQYEPHVVKHMEPLLNEGKVFWDVGANIGFFSLLAASRGAKSMAIEPNPYGYHLLNLSSRINGFSHKITVIPLAASNEEGLSAISHLGSNGTLHEHGNQPVYKMRLDDLAMESMPPPNVIKMDCEGHEMKAFEGLSRILKFYNPKIFLEYYPRTLNEHGSNHLEFLKLIKDSGFHISVLDKRTMERVRCDLMSQVMEIFHRAEEAETFHVAYLDLLLER